MIGIFVNGTKEGTVVSEKAQFFETGQTKVSFDWKSPNSNELSTYKLEAKVDLYGTSEITNPAVMCGYPNTQSMSAYTLPTLKVIENNGVTLSEPVLLYSLDSQNEFSFRVTAPDGMCIIGISDECAVNDSTKSNRGGLSSVPYGE